jgi:hypothetical protein
MQIRICQLAQQLVDAKIELGRRAPHALALGAQLLDEAKRMQLAVLFGRSAIHENKMRTSEARVKGLGFGNYTIRGRPADRKSQSDTKSRRTMGP